MKKRLIKYVQLYKYHAEEMKQIKYKISSIKNYMMQ